MENEDLSDVVMVSVAREEPDPTQNGAAQNVTVEIDASLGGDAAEEVVEQPAKRKRGERGPGKKVAATPKAAVTPLRQPSSRRAALLAKGAAAAKTAAVEMETAVLLLQLLKGEQGPDSDQAQTPAIEENTPVARKRRASKGKGSSSERGGDNTNDHSLQDLMPVDLLFGDSVASSSTPKPKKKRTDTEAEKERKEKKKASAKAAKLEPPRDPHNPTSADDADGHIKCWQVVAGYEPASAEEVATFKHDLIYGVTEVGEETLSFTVTEETIASIKSILAAHKDDRMKKINLPPGAEGFPRVAILAGGDEKTEAERELSGKNKSYLADSLTQLTVDIYDVHVDEKVLVIGGLLRYFPSSNYVRFNGHGALGHGVASLLLRVMHPEATQEMHESVTATSKQVSKSVTIRAPFTANGTVLDVLLLEKVVVKAVQKERSDVLNYGAKYLSDRSMYRTVLLPPAAPGAFIIPTAPAAAVVTTPTSETILYPPIPQIGTTDYLYANLNPLPNPMPDDPVVEQVDRELHLEFSCGLPVSKAIPRLKFHKSNHGFIMETHAGAIMVHKNAIQLNGLKKDQENVRLQVLIDLLTAAPDILRKRERAIVERIPKWKSLESARKKTSGSTRRSQITEAHYLFESETNLMRVAAGLEPVSFPAPPPTYASTEGCYTSPFQTTPAATTSAATSLLPPSSSFLSSSCTLPQEDPPAAAAPLGNPSPYSGSEGASTSALLAAAAPAGSIEGTEDTAEPRPPADGNFSLVALLMGGHQQQ